MHEDHVRPLAGNKMFMMQSIYHMDLDPARPSSVLKVPGVVLYLFDFPPKTGVSDILAAFTALGYHKEHLTLTWVDGTSTFVNLPGPFPIDTPELEEDMARVYSKNLSPWKMETLAQFHTRNSNASAPTSTQVTATPTTTATVTVTGASGLWSWVNYLTSSFTGSSSVEDSLSQVGKKRKL